MFQTNIDIAKEETVIKQSEWELKLKFNLAVDITILGLIGPDIKRALFMSLKHLNLYRKNMSVHFGKDQFHFLTPL